MPVIIFVPLLVALVGVLMYALSTNPKLAEIGRIMFMIGLLVFLWNDNAVVNILRR
jgi:hypothetical protein